jgi:hypothetical protein
MPNMRCPKREVQDRCIGHMILRCEPGVGCEACGIGRPVGYAAGRIADSLKDKGGYLVTPPEGFIVKVMRGH